jgi:hypothetical protein
MAVIEPDAGLLLDYTYWKGVTVVSSVRTRRNYLVPLELADDRPSLLGYIEYEDSQP